jgi:hypothetical protein
MKRDLKQSKKLNKVIIDTFLQTILPLLRVYFKMQMEIKHEIRKQETQHSLRKTV